MSGGSEGEEKLKVDQAPPAAEPTVEVAKEEFPPEYYLFKTAAEREAELADIDAIRSPLIEPPIAALRRVYRAIHAVGRARSNDPLCPVSTDGIFFGLPRRR